MRQRLKILASILLSSSVFANETSTEPTAIYRWVDQQGVVHFSDVAVPGAQRIELSKENSNQVALPKRSAQLAPSSLQAIDYQLTINQPLPNATIRNNAGTVMIQANLSPNAPQGTHYRITLNGQPWTQPGLSPLFKLENIDRGEHQFSVQAYDASGLQIASSTPQTFYLHRASTQINP